MVAPERTGRLRQLPVTTGSARRRAQIDAQLLLRSAGLTPGGTVTWGTRVPETAPGVYVISTLEPLVEAPIGGNSLAAWIAARPEMRVDGQPATVASLDARLRSFWIPGETIVYIGLGTSIANRMAQFYRTPLGARAPHAGGHWLKTLSVLHDLQVTWATTDDPDATEDRLLHAFATGLPAATRRTLEPWGPVLPFANLETGGKLRKGHGITGSKEPRTAKRSPSLPTSTPRVEAIGRAIITSRRRADLPAINEAIQRFAAGQPGRRTTAVDAAAELDRLGLLRDSQTRKGKPLRDLLRAGLIEHAYQEGTRWFIDHDGGPDHRPRSV